MTDKKKKNWNEENIGGKNEEDEYRLKIMMLKMNDE